MRRLSVPALIMAFGVAAVAGEKFLQREIGVAPDGQKIVELTPYVEPVPSPGADSPTGHTPTLLWSREQQAVWNRMRAESHPWLKAIIDLAEARTADEIYPNGGEHHVLAFQITGKREYGREAWRVIQPVITQPPANANTVREEFIEYVVWYDWLTPVLTEAERAEYLEGLNGWARWSLAKFGSCRDSDQVIGMYGGLRLLDKLTGSKWCEQLPPEVVPAIRQYCEWAKGGEWIESSPYNVGTTKLIAMLVAGVGDEAEPELAKYLDEAALAFCYRITPDLQGSYLWGDVQAAFGHDAFPKRVYAYLTTFTMLAHRNPHLRSLIDDLAKEYPTQRPWWRCLYLYDPYAKGKDWRKLPPIHFAEGQRVLTYKTADEMFVAHCPPRMTINGFPLDHAVSYASDFWLYRDGAWQVGHPLYTTSEYGGPPSLPHPANTLLLYGQQSMYDRTLIGWGETKDGCWITCDTSGPKYRLWSGRPYYDPPPAFVEKATRTIRYEGGRITLTDDVKLAPPTRLERYEARDRGRLTETPVSSVIWQGAELVTRNVDVEVSR